MPRFSSGLNSFRRAPLLLLTIAALMPAGFARSPWLIRCRMPLIRRRRVDASADTAILRCLRYAMILILRGRRLQADFTPLRLLPPRDACCAPAHTRRCGAPLRQRRQARRYEREARRDDMRV